MDDDRVYGYGRKPAYMVWPSPVEYQFFAADRRIDMGWIRGKAATQNVFDRVPRLQENPEKLSGARYRWQKPDYPLMVRAMALAGRSLLVAGIPDTVDEEKLYASFLSADLQAQAAEQVRAMSGEKGFVFRVVSADTRETRGELKGDAAPVWDGMAEAGGRVYIATVGGQVLCLSGSENN